MTAFLWILQVLLALHTLAGAFWKFSNSAEQAVPSLKAIPPVIWTSMSIVEIICAIMLVLPVYKKIPSKVAAIAASIIGAEMIIFSIVHFTSDATEHGQVLYWVVVAALCGFIAHKRCKLTAPTPVPQ